MSDENIEEIGRLMLGYLPAAYREDAESAAFLTKFLGVFGSEIMEGEDLIAQMPRYFDSQALTDKEADFLSWLAGWLSLNLFEQYAGKNAEFLLRASEFYKKKGTKAGLISLLEFFTDRQVMIKESVSMIFRSYIKDLIDEYHSMSLTVDTNDKELLAKIGKVDDRIHYTYPGLGDDGQEVRSGTIEIYIRMDLDEDKKALLSKLIEPFLPAMISANFKTLS